MIREWSGYDYQPIVQDAQGNNIYLGQPLLGQGPDSFPHMDAGVTDDSNCVSTSHARGGKILFTRLGPQGQHLTWLDTIYTGDPWSGRTSLARDPRGWLHLTFADGTKYLVYGVSTDKGASWTWDTLQTISVMSHVRVVTTPDTCVHIVFRTWTSGVQLYYMKLRPDGSVAVAPSVFTQGPERWCPNVAVDTSGNLRVVYVDGATQAHNLWYTVLRGDLDMNGQPAPDSLLTIVPDTIIQNDPVRLAGPKIGVDSKNRAHVLFEQGPYGTGKTKHVYHTREEIGPAVGGEIAQSKPILSVFPNPVLTSAKIHFGMKSPGRVRILLFDTMGREVEKILDRNVPAGLHEIIWNGEMVPAGVYFLRLEVGEYTVTRKIIRLL